MKDTNDRGLALTELARFLRDHYPFLCASAAVGLTAGLVYAFLTVPVYRATATIEVQDLNENFLNLKEVASASGPVSAVGDLQTQVRILQSGALIARVVERVGLPKAPTQQEWGLPVANAAPAAAVSNPPTDMEVEAASRGLQVRETRQSRIVDLSYESTDPAYAAAFVTELAHQYIDQSVESRLEISRGTSAWLTRQLEEMRAKLAESERGLQAYAQSSGLLVINDVQRPDEEKLRQVQQDLSKAQENRMAKQARREMAASAPLDSLEPPPGSALRDHRAKLGDLRRQRADLVAVYTPEFAAVKRLDAQIADLETTVRKDAASVLQTISNDYADAVRREKLLQQSYDRQASLVSAQATKAIQYGILKNEVNSNRELYNNMLQRAAEANVASALRASNARVVDRAKVPRRPFRPSRFLSMMTGGTMGLLLGLVLVTARDRSVRRVNNAAELVVLIPAPELGSVPDHAAPNLETYRAILTSILFSPNGESGPRVLAVTSANPGEGKSHLVFQLATTLSQLRRQVLMIDGSHDGRLQELFGQTVDCGLCDAVALTAGGEGLLPYLTQPTRLAGVHLASVGTHHAGALDLMFTRGFGQLLDEMRSAYDLILIDTPALLDSPDARVFARLSDGAILVVQARQTTHEAVRAAARRLQLDDSVLLGTVLNRA